MVGAEAMMSDAVGMTGVAELQELLLATDTLQEFLHEVAHRAAAEVSPGLSCGLTARSDGRPLTIASSDGYANMLDQLQYRLGQGPVSDHLAHRQGRTRRRDRRRTAVAAVPDPG